MVERKERKDFFFITGLICLVLFFVTGVYYIFEGPKVFGLEKMNRGLQNDLIFQLKKKEQLVANKENFLKQKELTLKALSHRMNIRQVRWENEQAELWKDLEKYDAFLAQEGKKDLQMLSQIGLMYQNMDSKEAAILLSKLETAVAAELLLNMPSYASAQIMSDLVKVSPDQAAAIAQKMKLGTLS